MIERKKLTAEELRQRLTEADAALTANTELIEAQREHVKRIDAELVGLRTDLDEACRQAREALLRAERLQGRLDQVEAEAAERRPAEVTLQGQVYHTADRFYEDSSATRLAERVRRRIFR